MKAKTYCIAYGCLNNNKDRNLSFFSLPKERDRRQQWLTLVNRPDLLEKDLKWSNYSVCSAHFEDSSIKIIKHLKVNSVPTKLLPNQSEGLSCSETQSTSAEIEDKVTILSNDERDVTVGNETESLQPTEEQTQTAKTLTNGTPTSAFFAQSYGKVNISNNINYVTAETETEIDSSQSHTTCFVQSKGKVIILSNNKKYVAVGTQTEAESMQSTNEPTQTSKLLTKGTARKRKLLNELRECKLKRLKLDQEISEIIEKIATKKVK